ncbi:sorting nexin-17-like isoform X2 [Macrosteles quadrilineatus]|uniref:sorting nexin-17-like isoform X2 n=1 Tax=Macrosteles quadrilineatus TaxID=74068 RepID=UPI0023E2BDCB|nr:sorting nexin-17-like isoform X2 [Macrosteles quadrilineatus]
MHFSIPDCQELKEDSSSSSYTGYNIHINGLYHCTVRYRQLHNLHEQLKRIHDPPNVPVFPPKKFLPLSSHQLEERRCHLEKYIQIVGQTPHLANTDVFTGFLLSAQLESSGEKNKEISLEVFLMNNLKLTVTCNVNESSSQILEKICGKLSLPITYMYYFALFLINRDDDGDITILRKLQDFESPYISQKTYKDPTTLVIRKSYWDPVYDEELMGDKIALNLLYTQTLAEMERGWILCTRDTQAQLASLQARGAKKQYLEIARNLKYYGYTQFLPCTCNYPDPGTACVVSAGYKELCLRVKLDGGDTREGAFKVTRMKCWRITIHNDTEEPQLELSFEYLIAKEQLQWIRIFSDQAILMSVCLQSMVDELLLKKVGAKIKQPTIKAKNGCYNYMKRDGSNHQISVSQSSSFDCLTSPTNGHANSPTRSNEPSLSMRKLSEKLTSVSLKNKTQPLVENDAFEGIGDEDL